MIPHPKPNPTHARPQAEKRNKELQSLGVGVKVVCVGKKATSYFKRRLDRFEVAGAGPKPCLGAGRCFLCLSASLMRTVTR